MLVYNGAFHGKKLGVMTYYTDFPPGAFPSSPRQSVVQSPASAFEAAEGSPQDVPLSMRADAGAASEPRPFPIVAAVIAGASLVAALVV